GLCALDPDRGDALLLELHREMLGHGADLAGRAARGDHHVVGEAGFSVEVDDDDVFRLVVVEGFLDESDEFSGDRRTLLIAFPSACYGAHPSMVDRTDTAL